MAGVDIIIPIFEAAEALAACVDSVLRHTDFADHGLILVIDGPQSADVQRILDDPRLHEIGATMLTNPKRAGFVAGANRGMAASERDIVLLNSDTEVTAQWIKKLTEAAYSAPEIATVTPFSNNATVCSLPETLIENCLPSGFDTDQLAQIVEQTSLRTRPRIPTGVGVCLFIKREVLDEIGLFDQEAFGLGYGEETDFCLRATARGRIHILDDATFIFHRGQQSFSQSTRARSARAMRTVRKRHPRYYGDLARFISEDPIAPLRERVIDAISPSSKTNRRRRILHLVHGWPPWACGGAENYASWLAEHQAQHSEVAVFARISDPHRSTGAQSARLDRSIRCRFVVNNFDQRNPLARNAIANHKIQRTFAGFIRDFNPDLIHVHHLSGTSATLMGAAKAHGAPIIYQVQDWWSLCARANLIDSEQRLCDGPRLLRCSRCLPLTKLPGAHLLNPLLYRVRNQVLKHQLAHADAYVMGSESVRHSYESAGLLAPNVPVHVLPYGVPMVEPAGDPLQASLPLKFGFIGSLMPHKGAHIAIEAFAGIDAAQAQLQIWGDPTALPDYSRTLVQQGQNTPIRLMGPFDERDKARILSDFDVLLVPSIGLESFGLVAREAMLQGTPVIASRLGALAELDIDGSSGALFEAGSTTQLRAILRDLIDNPQTIDRWQHQLPAIKTTADHALEIDEICDGLLQ